MDLLDQIELIEELANNRYAFLVIHLNEVYAYYRILTDVLRVVGEEHKAEICYYTACAAEEMRDTVYIRYSG